MEVKGPHPDFHSRFTLEDKGELISIKFSLNFSILALQRNLQSVEFVNFRNCQLSSREYSLRCKSRNARILGFVWIGHSHIAVITDAGLEFHQLHSDRLQNKPIKSFMINVAWFMFQPSSSIVLLATGSHANLFQPFYFRESSMFKLPKFEVELNTRGSPERNVSSFSASSSVSPSSSKQVLCERDCAFVSLYGKTCLLVIRHGNSQRDFSGAYISVYTVQKDGHTRQTHLLQLFLTGRFAINLVDDLVVVHHQTSQTSLLFDIQQTPVRVERSVAYHSPIVPPYTIKPLKHVETGAATSNEVQNVVLYSTSWVVYQPNVIIDARLGHLWKLQLNLLPLCRMMADEAQLFEFLISRRNSKKVLINLCKQSVLNERSDLPTNRLATVSFLFHKLNKILKEHMNLQQSKNSSSTNDRSGRVTVTTGLASISLTDAEQKRPIIDQQDMYQSIFNRFGSRHSNVSEQFIIAVLLEYINSLLVYQIPVQYYLYELLINVLVRNRMFFQLHQYLQYHVFADSKPLACLLLSLNQQYPPAVQLALDMFKRLNVDTEYILDIFVTKMDLLRALRYMGDNHYLDSVSARKYLEYAMNSSNEQLFYAVFRCFEQRNLRLRGSTEFAKGNQKVFSSAVDKS